MFGRSVRGRIGTTKIIKQFQYTIKPLNHYSNSYFIFKRFFNSKYTDFFNVQTTPSETFILSLENQLEDLHNSNFSYFKFHKIYTEALSHHLFPNSNFHDIFLKELVDKPVSFNNAVRIINYFDEFENSLIITEETSKQIFKILVKYLLPIDYYKRIFIKLQKYPSIESIINLFYLIHKEYGTDSALDFYLFISSLNLQFEEKNELIIDKITNQMQKSEEEYQNNIQNNIQINNQINIQNNIQNNVQNDIQNNSQNNFFTQLNDENYSNLLRKRKSSSQYYKTLFLTILLRGPLNSSQISSLLPSFFQLKNISFQLSYLLITCAGASTDANLIKQIYNNLPLQNFNKSQLARIVLSTLKAYGTSREISHFIDLLCAPFIDDFSFDSNEFLSICSFLNDNSIIDQGYYLIEERFRTGKTISISSLSAIIYGCGNISHSKLGYLTYASLRNFNFRPTIGVINSALYCAYKSNDFRLGQRIKLQIDQYGITANYHTFHYTVLLYLNVEHPSFPTFIKGVNENEIRILFKTSSEILKTLEKKKFSEYLKRRGIQKLQNAKMLRLDFRCYAHLVTELKDKIFSLLLPTINKYKAEREKEMMKKEVMKIDFNVENDPADLEFDDENIKLHYSKEEK